MFSYLAKIIVAKPTKRKQKDNLRAFIQAKTKQRKQAENGETTGANQRK